ncbi:formiminoglutamase [Clonorchis sinensis]|uniref:Formiminoglutamase n=1 Tax=Clonorchis sinensis TaxID=79923 RepID=G7YES7_CLOSI|nr:formiminoglutamase [Clonorchis sinensis]
MNRPGDPRLGRLLIGRKDFDNLKERAAKNVGLILVPCDEGVDRNGGRVGACDGPAVVMDLLPRFGVLDNREWKINLETAGIQLVDYGSTGSSNLEEVHNTLKGLVKDCLKNHLFPLCIGGGNDQSWANGAAWIEHLRTQSTQQDKGLKLTAINIDAHLDVRPLIKLEDGSQVSHSGSPFRQLLEMAHGQEDFKLIEFAAQGQQCSGEHVDYVQNHGGTIIWFSQLAGYETCTEHGGQHPKSVKIMQDILQDCEASGRHVFFSFDLDAIQAADCPGVSCPSPIGLMSREALGLCYVAGKSKAVDLMDISEFNPHVESTQTSRLIVNMIYCFLLGFSQRYL